MFKIARQRDASEGNDFLSACRMPVARCVSRLASAPLKPNVFLTPHPKVDPGTEREPNRFRANSAQIRSWPWLEPFFMPRSLTPFKKFPSRWAAGGPSPPFPANRVVQVMSLSDRLWKGKRTKSVSTADPAADGERSGARVSQAPHQLQAPGPPHLLLSGCQLWLSTVRAL